MAIRITAVKQTRRLTLTGWLLVMIICGSLFYTWMVTAHNFLAVHKPIKTHILVIEGYLSDWVLDSLATTTGLHQDSLLFVCAGLPWDKGVLCPEYNNYAIYNAGFLKSMGVDSTRIISAPAILVHNDRTYITAMAVREKLESLGYTSGGLNVVCSGTHARRSQLLYRKAFKSEWKVGVICIFEKHYPAGAWWRTSEGVRAVVYEMFAYLYCLIFFHP